MQRHADWEVNIAFRQVPKNKVGPRETYFKAVHDAYTKQYLEALGVHPSSCHRKTIAREAPLERCQIEATWNDDSAVAANLRILQPLVGNPAHSAPVEVVLQEPDRDKDLLKGWKDMAEIISVAAPSLSMPEVRAPQSPRGEHGFPSREEVLLAMQMHDKSKSKRVNESLVAELDKVRRTLRGEEELPAKPVRSSFKHWGEQGLKELNSLKRKFILPFAVEKPGRGPNAPTIVLPWQSTEFLEHMKIQSPPEYVADFMEPVCTTPDEIKHAVASIVDYQLPLELLTSHEEPALFQSLRDSLQSNNAVRLVGLMAHVLYWTAFGSLHDPSQQLPLTKQQSILISAQELWARLVEECSAKACQGAPTRHSFVVSATLLTLKRGIEQVFLKQYESAFTDTDHGEVLSGKLVDQLNYLMMNIFDPDCVAASFGALDTGIEAIKLWKRLHLLQMKVGLTPATRTLCHQFRTTPLMLLLMNSDNGGPADAKTRRLLSRSTSDTVLAAVSGVQMVEANSKGRSGQTQAVPRLDEYRRAKAYSSACERLARAGRQMAGQLL